MQNTDHGFDPFIVRQRQLTELAERVKKQVQSLEETKSRVNVIAELAEKVRSDTFKLLVLGEFKSGKSTFINALLGQKILPSYAWPTTAIINEIKWGDPPRAVLFERVSENAPPKSREIDVKEIEKYVVIQDASVEGVESPYERLDLYWNLPLCENKVELIDSPGLNEAKVRSDVTMSYLTKVDAVLFVLTCDKPVSQSEMHTLEILKTNGFEHTFLVFNRFDVIDPEEQNSVKRYAYSKLDGITRLGQQGIYFISSLKALNGKVKNDPALTKESGIEPLEKHLQSFLVHDRGRIKILQPATHLMEILPQIENDIAVSEQMLAQTMETLRKLYEEAQEPLQRLELQRSNIKRRISNFRHDVKDLSRQRAREFYANLERKVGPWLENYRINQPFSVLSSDFLHPKGAGERVVKEVSEFLHTKIESESAQWQSENLRPFLDTRLGDLKSELDEMAKKFLTDIDDVKSFLSGQTIAPTISSAQDAAKISPMERILAAAGGFVMGDIVSAGVGYAFGFKDMLKNLVVQIGVVVAGAIFGITNPWVLLVAAMGAGGVTGFLRGTKVNEKIKTNIGNCFIEQIRAKSAEMSEQIATKVFEKLEKLEANVDQGLANEIQSIHDQAQAALNQKKKGQAEVEAKLRQLDGAKKELRVVRTELTDLINSTAVESIAV